MTMSMIIAVTLTVPSSDRRSISRLMPRNAAAIAKAPATPTAAASVGVAQPW